jgi:toxin-antitoxin system PIN domain toxin
MIALLDANVVIALFDAAHVHHQQAHQWLTQNRAYGWATCPLTQNACIRIMSQPAYPGRLTIADAARRLHNAAASADHHFWPDRISLCNPALFAHGKILSSKYLTDLYLLALAVEQQGRLVTFDQNIPTAAVPGAIAANLVVL